MCSRIGKTWRSGRKVAMVFTLVNLLAASGNAWGQINPPIISPPIGPFSPSIGWRPLVRNQSSSLALSWTEFDWTGLLYTVTPSYAPGATGTPPQPTTNYGQLAGLMPFGLPDINSLGATIEAHGNPMVYKWQWVPPSVPRDQSQDWQHFPAPALFVLGRVDSSLNGSASGPTTVTGHLGVLGTEWMKCNTDAEFLNIVGGGTAANPLLTNGNALLLSRAVLSAGNSSTPQITITPTAEATGTTASDPQTRHPTGYGSVGMGVAGKGFPITLFNPRPFSVPQLGDDSNKFVYDSTFPDGVLTLPLVAQVVGASQNDTQWLVENNKVGWAVHPGIDGWIPYTSKMAQGDKVFPITNGQMNVALYKGLPDSDTGFGLKEVLLKVEGLDSQRTFIQTYFSSTAKNHPYPALYPQTDEVTGLPVGPSPNWFYYYNKLYSAAPARYADTSPSYCLAGLQFDSEGEPIDGYGPQTVKRVIIGNDAFSNGSVPVFKRGLFGMMTLDGLLYINGIHKYVYVLGHELGHAEDYTTGVLNYKFAQTSATGWRGYDEDGDGVTRKAELMNGLNPADNDTTMAFGNSPTGDAEVLACIHGLAKLLPTKDLWKRDWSSAGLQYNGLDDPFWGPFNPDTMYSAYWGWPVNTPYHPWDYETVVVQFGHIFRTGDHHSDPPSDPVTQVLNPYTQFPYP